MYSSFELQGLQCMLACHASMNSTLARNLIPKQRGFFFLFFAALPRKIKFKMSSDSVDKEVQEETRVTSVVDVLSKTVSGLKKNMSVVFQRMSGSLQHSLAMMDSMNSCMEEYVKNGLRTEVLLNRAAGSFDGALLSLKITARNSGRFPLTNIKLYIALKDSNGSVVTFSLSKEPNIETSCKRQKLSHGNEYVWRSHCTDKDDADTPPSSCEVGPLNLNAAAVMTWNIEINVARVAQYKGRLIARFPSPGTGSVLETGCCFDAGLIHQCHFCLDNLSCTTTPVSPVCTAPPLSGVSEGQLAAVRVVPLRRLLGIPARAAINEGALAALHGPGGAPVCIPLPDTHSLPGIALPNARVMSWRA